MTLNQHTHKKNVEKGLTIYKTGRSRFWMARFWDRRQNKYIVKSTGETRRTDATEVAREWKDGLLQDASQHIAKANSDDSFEYYARMVPKSDKDDWVIFNRAGDGVLAVLGDYDVKAVTTAVIRSYLTTLNENRRSPLAVSTQKKHVITIRKALKYALENGKIQYLPESPKISTQVDKPRPSFTSSEYADFWFKIKQMAKDGKVDEEFPSIVRFIPHTFVRPTEGELMGLRVRDIEVHDEESPIHLKMDINKGKTGYRRAVSVMRAVSLFKQHVEKYSLGPDDYVWYHQIENRKYAITKFSRLFTKCLKDTGFQYTNDGQKRTAYSLRHYALMNRMQSSGGQTNVLSLAKNAGTSVEVLERFYLKNLAPNSNVIKNLQHYEDSD